LQPTQTIYALAGTKWKLVGYVSLQDQKLIEAEPKDCEECYTLTFETDTTGKAISVSNLLSFNLLSNSWRGTLIGDQHIGNAKLFYNAIEIINLYSVENDTLKLYYNNRCNYLLFKSLDK
jgi:hypothetical protein